jgi:hypothetical protein
LGQPQPDGDGGQLSMSQGLVCSKGLCELHPFRGASHKGGFSLQRLRWPSVKGWCVITEQCREMTRHAVCGPSIRLQKTGQTVKDPGTRVALKAEGC